jgi:glucose-fructose oxidoreductase
MARNGARRPARSPSKIRFAVIGQGHFAQTAILPAFGHARSHCALTALVSGDEQKRKRLARRYKVPHALPYEELDDFLRSGAVDAVYVAVPNHLHKDVTVRAARAGVHVLCEKPMAVTARECRDMIAACDEARVKLMIAYRLHLEKANLTAVEELRRGRIGQPRYFSSVFSFQLDEDNIRANPTEQGGGPLYDIGIYCINAARYLFRDEPTEAVALAATRLDDGRFTETDEQLAGILRFPGERLATFTIGFGAAHASAYTVVGSAGSIRLDPAYSHAGALQMEEHTARGQRRRSFARRDQVAPELIYFADCIQRDREPEPSGWEGLHDVTIIEALLDSARSGRKIDIHLERRRQRPTRAHAIDRPPVREPAPIHAEPPRG